MNEEKQQVLNTEQLLLMMVAHAGNANAKVFDALDAYEAGNREAGGLAGRIRRYRTFLVRFASRAESDHADSILICEYL